MNNQCKYCYGKGSYSRFKAGGKFGDSFDGYVYIEPEIETHPCKRCQPVEGIFEKKHPTGEDQLDRDRELIEGWKEQCKIAKSIDGEATLNMLGINNLLAAQDRVTEERVKAETIKILEQESQAVFCRYKEEFSREQRAFVEDMMREILEDSISKLDNQTKNE